MKVQAVLSVCLLLMPSLSGLQDIFFSTFSGNFKSMNEQTVIGRFNEDIILPCSFESGPNVVIHWKNQDDQNVHSYFKGNDYLEKQDPDYTNRTSLFHTEILHGNASLSLRRLSLLDVGVYICYTATDSKINSSKVVLKVGAFQTPTMKYEKRNTNSFLVCSVSGVYPHPHISWKVDNESVSESKTEEFGDLGPFYINSTLTITGSHSSYECTIENSLLKQTWTGQWTLGDISKRMQNEGISLSCKVISNFFLLNQDFNVTWSRVKSETSSILAHYASSLQNNVINEPRFSWNKNIIDQNDFSMTLTNIVPSDSGEYLCHISSNEYTSLITHMLHVEPKDRSDLWRISVILLLILLGMVTVIGFILRRGWIKSRTEAKGNRCSADEAQPSQPVLEESRQESHSGEVKKHRKKQCFGIVRLCHLSTDESASNDDHPEENIPLS